MDADSPVVFIAGDTHPALAEQLAGHLGGVPAALKTARFADGEIQIHLAQDVRNAEVFVLQTCSPPVNDAVVGLALMIDAARAAGAARITAIVPYLGYTRQDTRSRVGEPRSAQVIARLLAAVELDHLVAVDLHTPALESCFSMPLTQLTAAEVLLPAIAAWRLENLVVVSPDAGGLKRAQRWANLLEAKIAMVVKTRGGIDRVQHVEVLGEVQDAACLLVDDIVSTGGTLGAASEMLKQAGAREVHAAFTHPVLSTGALQRLLDSPLDRLLTTDTLPGPSHARLQVVGIAPLLAGAVWQLLGEGPVE